MSDLKIGPRSTNISFLPTQSEYLLNAGGPQCKLRNRKWNFIYFVQITDKYFSSRFVL